MNTILDIRIGGMRAIIPMAMMVVPGAAFAQVADHATPVALAPFSEQAAAESLVPATALTQFIRPLSLADSEVQIADVDLPAVAFASVQEAAAQPIVLADAASTHSAAEAFAPAEQAIAIASLADAADASVTPGASVALAEQVDTLFAGAPVTEVELADTKGKAFDGWMAALANNNSNVSNNNIGDHSNTGDVNVTGSFTNANGFSMVNINTGTASSINAAMSVNLQINYAASPNP